MQALTIEEMDRHTHLFSIGFTPDMFGELLTLNTKTMGIPTQPQHPMQAELDYIKTALDNPAISLDLIAEIYEIIREYEEDENTPEDKRYKEDFEEESRQFEQEMNG